MLKIKLNIKKVVRWDLFGFSFFSAVIKEKGLWMAPFSLQWRCSAFWMWGFVDSWNAAWFLIMPIAKDKRAKKLGMPPGTLLSNDKDPVLLVLKRNIFAKAPQSMGSETCA